MPGVERLFPGLEVGHLVGRIRCNGKPFRLPVKTWVFKGQLPYRAMSGRIELQDSFPVRAGAQAYVEFALALVANRTQAEILPPAVRHDPLGLVPGVRQSGPDEVSVEIASLDETRVFLFAEKDRQIWLFSATVKAGISDIMRKHMQDTVAVRVTPKMVATEQTKQYFCIVPFRSRTHAITRFIQATSDFYGFVFCQTKILTSEVAEQLSKRGYNVAALHGDLSQAQRNAVIKKFKQRAYTILVATDVAARGIDVPNTTHVINYSVPDDLESYVHRIGRTGRAGKEGIAITFISRSELRTVQHIERRFNVRIEPIDVPSRELVTEKRLAVIPDYIQELMKKKVPEQQTLEKFVQDLTPEDLKKMASQLLYDKFFATLDLEEIPYVQVGSPEMGEFQEIYISVGSDDGVTVDAVRKFLLQTPVIKPEQIMTIRVIKRRSFVKLSSDCSPDLVRSLRGKLLDGRKVHVNVTCLIGDRRGVRDRILKSGRGTRHTGGRRRR